MSLFPESIFILLSCAACQHKLVYSLINERTLHQHPHISVNVAPPIPDAWTFTLRVHILQSTLPLISRFVV
ncbi:uncharacterized protein BT62DRAFT_1071517 [Guyanagaster necrorhizus]|uniref:Uncharacterized protein n=1 Tax=Guyanagaster necrorhizus TaxID=856835 RepID=A0A9P8AY07_9AGAR|nr:uncharacterized protein BT62DRAFT_1071517 [Guyanagaster necrorhizus MCA 3950]KAG7452374.1 hypothetical protein BT62DRAFT_1071517 [Guyanagaster necrorhizus MCA 3950]